MRFQHLQDWLSWQENLHPTEIELGLERCREVGERLGLMSADFYVFTVAGTNGKGSSAGFLDSILRAAGYRCGRFLSPHLLRYNERISIDGQDANDRQLCEAFAAIDAARGAISLTYFEFGALAALWLFQQAKVDVAVLEVGLGGRLDAVNIIDADVALITAIGLDHMDWLGSDREVIGREKAGILRAARPAVCSDPRPPQSLRDYAQELNTPLSCLGEDYYYQVRTSAWDWQNGKQNFTDLPLPGLAGAFQLQNAAGVLQALGCARERLPVKRDAIEQGLRDVRLPGRLQSLPGRVPTLLDVAHNPLGARALRIGLENFPCRGQRHALVGMFKDKDIEATLAALRDAVDVWHPCTLENPRGATAQRLSDALAASGIAAVEPFPGVRQGFQTLRAELSAQDQLLVFGSFVSVKEALQAYPG